ncbi:MAG TPA: flagellar motor switch protein FliN [Bryobacteraceae bacterium]|nr:flagellar motor switch protein FliN [Bryobacteraceae bacterium]
MNSATDIRQWLFEEFSARLAAVFETMVGERPRIEIEPLHEAPADATLRWKQPFSGIGGAVWVAASEAGWTSAGGRVLRAAGIEESDPATLKSTYLETVSQAVSGLAGAMGARLGREVNCAGGEESSTALADARAAALKVQFGAERAVLVLGVETALIDALAASQACDPVARIEETAAAAGGVTGPGNSKTFELLLDVELPVSVSFGRAQVVLKDVLKLTTGSIVELNRSVLEPVEVIVNNCVIARGEVVVVEGNFGVRVHQVISRQERLRTLN